MSKDDINKDILQRTSTAKVGSLLKIYHLHSMTDRFKKTYTIIEHTRMLGTP